MSGKTIRLVINVDVQVKATPGYPVVSRAVYYLARLVSRQKGTVFVNSEYEKIRKVPDPSKKNSNSIAEYGFAKQKAIGSVNEPIQNYDKMKAVIIRLLSTLLSATEPLGRRKKTLEEEFHISMTGEMEEDIKDMCNLGEAVLSYGESIGEQRGREIGAEETTLAAIRSLKETLNLSTQQAMDALKFSEEEQKKFASLV